MGSKNLKMADCIIDCMVGGVGFHADEIDPKYTANNFKLTLGHQTAYPIELGLTKCSIAYLLMTIFETKTFKRLAWCVIAVCIAWGIMTIIIGFAICQPLTYTWAPAGDQGHCGNIPAAWTSVGVLDVVFDLCLLILPMPWLYRLNMPWYRKLAIGAIFGLAIM